MAIYYIIMIIQNQIVQTLSINRTIIFRAVIYLHIYIFVSANETETYQENKCFWLSDIKNYDLHQQCTCEYQ